MAGQAGQSPVDLEQDLLANADCYEFYQAVRLLARLRETGDGQDGLSELRIRPELSLDHPETELAALERRPEGGYELTTTFMGLYGISSPLPAFYTEDLLDEAWEERSAGRDFLDIIHHHLYPLLYQAWRKYRLAQRAVECGEEQYWRMVYSLLGLGDKVMLQSTGEAELLLPYLGLLSQSPKSQVGLETLLRDALQLEELEVIPCQPRNMVIPLDQRLALGREPGRLGKDAVLGDSIRERMGKFTIHIRADAALLQRMLNDHAFTARLELLVRFYLNQPLEMEVMLSLPAKQIAPPGLGEGAWSCLGSDCWLGGVEGDDEIRVSLRLLGASMNPA